MSLLNAEEEIKRAFEWHIAHQETYHAKYARRPRKNVLGDIASAREKPRAKEHPNP